jgi:hypothetical protein
MIRREAIKMMRWYLLTVRTVVMGVGLAVGAGACMAAGDFMSSPPDDTTYEQSLYREPPSTKPSPQAIVQQKAMLRADQRQARLASSAWYGMSNSRPNGATTPFTSRYSPMWEMPGGRPFSWTPYNRFGYLSYWR